MKVEAEREQARAERERLREEIKVMKEIERERARLAQEQAHYATVVTKLEANGNLDALAREQLASVDDVIAGVEKRAANVRAGYVYVISNIGAFGPDVVKIGTTRRLDPTDRVRELGDASVPFRFDTHALFFSKNEVALETALHQRLIRKRGSTSSILDASRHMHARVAHLLVDSGQPVLPWVAAWDVGCASWKSRRSGGIGCWWRWRICRRVESTPNAL